MEQRHGEVARAVGAEAEAHGHDAGDAGEAALAALHRLGGAARAGREQEQVEVVGAYRATLVGERGVDGGEVGAGVGGEALVVGGVVEAPHPVGAELATEVEPVEQVGVGRVDDEHLAVGVGDVPGQLGAPAGRVDADDRGAGEGRGAEPVDVLGDVVGEDADVQGTRSPLGQEQRGALGGGGGGLGPRP